MECPKCRHSSPETAEYCLRCHAPLRIVCPACQHVQLHVGQCEQCGVDFAKYVAMLHFQLQTEVNQERARAKDRSAIFKQLLLLPVTGGLSLIKYLRSRIRGE